MSSALYLVIALAMGAPADGTAEQSEGESLLAQAMFERRSGRIDRALSLLTEAELLLSEPRLLAEIDRQRGWIETERARPTEALRSFIRMMTLDPDRARPESAIELPDGAEDILQCARRAVALGLGPDAVSDDRVSEPWQCSDVLVAVSLPTLSSTVTATGPDAPPPHTLTTVADTSSLLSDPPLATWVLGGVAAASLGTGIAMGVAARGQATDADAGSDGQGLATAANVTFAIAGAAAVAAVTWWVLEE